MTIPFEYQMWQLDAAENVPASPQLYERKTVDGISKFSVAVPVPYFERRYKLLKQDNYARLSDRILYGKVDKDSFVVLVSEQQWYPRELAEKIMERVKEDGIQAIRHTAVGGDYGW